MESYLVGATRKMEGWEKWAKVLGHLLQKNTLAKQQKNILVQFWRPLKRWLKKKLGVRTIRLSSGNLLLFMK
uniref:Uncharacterized protein n=1 Tax=Arundo donax TaxID=35708 RepID=A0A0A9G1E7_ARUDO